VIHVKVREIIKTRSQPVGGTGLFLKTFILNLFYEVE